VTNELFGVDDYSNAAAFKVAWWKDRYFCDALIEYWPEQLEACPEWSETSGMLKVTRDDVFRVAESEHPLRNVRTAVAAYVWGIGKNAYQVGWMVRAFTRNESRDLIEKLDRAVATMTELGPVEAYASMISSEGLNKVHYMGPAYFTKFLYFVGYRFTPPGKIAPLILDKRVATALRRWNLRPDLADGNWSADDYNWYLDYASRQKISAEAVERTLLMSGDRNEPAIPRPNTLSPA
jgi:hypothetical protein